MDLPLFTLGRGTQLHISKYGPSIGVPNSPLVPCLPLHSYLGVIYGKYSLVSITFSLRPNSAMLSWYGKRMSMITKIVLFKQYKEFYNNN